MCICVSLSGYEITCNTIWDFALLTKLKCSVILLLLLPMVKHAIDSPLKYTKYYSIWQISVIHWCCVCIAPWNWAQSGKKLIVTFMVHAMCIQCRVWTLPWSFMHSVVTTKSFGQTLCRGRLSMSYWFK